MIFFVKSYFKLNVIFLEKTIHFLQHVENRITKGRFLKFSEYILGRQGQVSCEGDDGGPAFWEDKDRAYLVGIGEHP